MVNRLQYVGPSTSKKVPGTRTYVDTVKATGITLAQVDSTIDSRASAYVTPAYVDTADAQRASLTYVNDQDNLRIPNNWRSIANGTVPLDSSGLVPATQLGLLAPISPDYQWGAAGLPTSNKTVSSTSATQAMGTITIPAGNSIVSGSPWTLLVWGYFEVYQNNSNSAAYIDVRLNNPTTGTLVARGRAARGRMQWGPVNIMPCNPVEIPKSTAAQTFYITARNGGSGAVEYSPQQCGVMGLLVPGGV